MKTIDSPYLMVNHPEIYEAWHRMLVKSWEDMPTQPPRDEAQWRAHLMERYGLEITINDTIPKPSWKVLIHCESGETEFMLRYL